MPSIITDEKIKEDCFDMRFPIAALNVLKPTGSGVQGIKAPPLPLYYPASIKSLGVGLAKTSGLPQAQVVNFIERKVRQEIAGLEEEKVEELPILDIEEEIEIEGEGVMGGLSALSAEEPVERGRTMERRGRPLGSLDVVPRGRRTKEELAETELMAQEDIRTQERQQERRKRRIRVVPGAAEEQREEL